jgi:hypothetical protein
MARSQLSKNWSTHPVEKRLAQGAFTHAASLPGQAVRWFCVLWNRYHAVEYRASHESQWVADLFDRSVATNHRLHNQTDGEAEEV